MDPRYNLLDILWLPIGHGRHQQIIHRPLEIDLRPCNFALRVILGQQYQFDGIHKCIQEHLDLILSRNILIVEVNFPGNHSLGSHSDNILLFPISFALHPLDILLLFAFLLGLVLLEPVFEDLLGLLAEYVLIDVQVVPFLFDYGADFEGGLGFVLHYVCGEPHRFELLAVHVAEDFYVLLFVLGLGEAPVD